MTGVQTCALPIFYWISDAVDGPSFATETNEFIATSDFAVLAQKGVDVPGNQPVDPRPYDDFDLDDLHVSDDGTRWLVRGDIGTPTSDDDALFVDGQIVIRGVLKTFDLIAYPLLILMIISPYRQRLGDMVAQTVVVAKAPLDPDVDRGGD